MDPAEFLNAFGNLVRVSDEKWGEYYTFIPSKLPPTITFNPRMVLHLTKAEATLSKLSGAALVLPNPELLINPYLKKEAISSSRIEGTRISLEEYLLFELENRETEDSLEVKNYLEAINFALKQINHKQIDFELIQQMHELLMQGVRGHDKSPGKVRTIQNWIGRPGSKPQTAHFVPPPAAEVKNHLQEMFSYMNTYDELPLLIKCALIHYQFETIHPFCDGNGRIGRALIVLYLLKKNKLSEPLLYISEYFEKYKSDYMKLLAQTNKTGNFDDWIIFFLQAIETQSESALSKVLELYELKKKYTTLVQNQSSAGKMLKIIEILFHSPYVSISKIEKIADTTYPTAKRIVENFVELKILTLRTDTHTRNKIYMAQEIINIVKSD
jgi:Fic family protein